MENALVTAAIFLAPTSVLVAAFLMAGRKVEWISLLWAALAFAVYFLLLRSEGVISTPSFASELELNWFGKALTLVGSVVMLILIPRVSLRAAGVTWRQNSGSLRPAIVTGAITLFVTIGVALLVAPSPNTSTENLLFQATMPGPDEELFVRGLLLLLFHQTFGKGLSIFGADTGWGFWLVVVIFGLLHGVSFDGGHVVVNVWMILGTGYVGFILTWMRERTGSLAIPILFHNIFNVAQAFV